MRRRDISLLQYDIHSFLEEEVIDVVQIEELSQSLSYQTTDLEQQCKASEAGVKHTVDGILKSDDKLLLSLQKLSSDLEPGRADDDAIIERIRELCAR